VTGTDPTLPAPPPEAPDLEELPDGVLVLDAGRRVAAANAAASRLLRLPANRLVGATLSALGACDEAGRPPWAEGWGPATRLRGVRGVPEQELRFGAGTPREVTVSATAAYRREPDGAVGGAVVVLRDAGGRGRRRAAGAIEVVSTVSHELRSPLTSVKGYTSLLLNRWDRLGEEDKRMMLAQVHHDADRVTRLVTELLDISRLESGRLSLRRQRVDVPALAASILDKVRLEYPDLDAVTSWPDGLAAAWADPDKVEQVLTNLVENACKYASPEGLVVAGGADGVMVWVSVSDRGEGIPAADLPQVFTKFFRRSEGRPTGSGLGLWISRGLVEAHGGQLSATSVPGEGSTFRFTLPVADREDRSTP
jgi:signal transduction histidine kinase